VGASFPKDATKYSITTWSVPSVGLQLRSRQVPVQAPTETLSWGSPVAYFKRMLPSLCNETGFCGLWKRGPHGPTPATGGIDPVSTIAEV